eukprot:110746-Amphidinium_carterae.1
MESDCKMIEDVPGWECTPEQDTEAQRHKWPAGSLRMESEVYSEVFRRQGEEAKVEEHREEMPKW